MTSLEYPSQNLRAMMSACNLIPIQWGRSPPKSQIFGGVEELVLEAGDAERDWDFLTLDDWGAIQNSR